MQSNISELRDLGRKAHSAQRMAQEHEAGSREREDRKQKTDNRRRRAEGSGKKSREQGAGREKIDDRDQPASPIRHAQGLAAPRGAAARGGIPDSRFKIQSKGAGRKRSGARASAKDGKGESRIRLRLQLRRDKNTKGRKHEKEGSRAGRRTRRCLATYGAKAGTSWSSCASRLKNNQGNFTTKCTKHTK